MEKRILALPNSGSIVLSACGDAEKLKLVAFLYRALAPFAAVEGGAVVLNQKRSSREAERFDEVWERAEIAELPLFAVDPKLHSYAVRIALSQSFHTGSYPRLCSMAATSAVERVSAISNCSVALAVAAVASSRATWRPRTV